MYEVHELGPGGGPHTKGCLTYIGMPNKIGTLPYWHDHVSPRNF